MKTKGKFLTLVSILSIFAIVLAGCGSSNTSEKASGDGTYTFKVCARSTRKPYLE